MASPMTALRDTLRHQGWVVHVGGTVRGEDRQVVLERAGGPADDMVPGFAELTVRAHVWGGDSYTEVERDADRLERWFTELSRTPLGERVTALGASVDSNLDAPDPASHRPRQVLTVRLTVLTQHEGDM